MKNMNNVPALIMAGGFGKRLRPLTDKMPKAMIKVGGKPLIYWQIRWLEQHGVEKFILLGGYKAEKLKRYIKSIGYDSQFEYSIERKPLGTGGAIKNAEDLLEGYNSFLVSNGDNVTDQDLGKLRLHGRFKACVSLVPYRSSKGIAKISGEKILYFEEKPIIKGLWYNAGAALISSEVLKILPKEGSLEQETFPALARRGRLSCARFGSAYYFGSVDSFKDMEVIDKDLRSGKVRLH